MDANVLYLDIPYSLKDEAKKYNIRWDPNQKKWYSLRSNRYLPQLTKTYIDVPFKDKDYVKKRGACWDAKEKCWFTLAFNKSLTEKYDKLEEPEYIEEELDFLDDLLHNK